MLPFGSFTAIETTSKVVQSGNRGMPSPCTNKSPTFLVTETEPPERVKPTPNGKSMLVTSPES